MKPFTLKQLINITPIEKNLKQKLTIALPKLNQIQKFELRKMCWDSIILMTQNLTKTKRDQMFSDMKSGKAIYNKQDFKNAEKEIFNKLLVKIDETQSTEESEALKAQLKTPDSPPPIE